MAALAALPALGLSGLIGGLAWFGRRPGYSHWRHTISELGEAGAPRAAVVAWAWFLPIGLLCLLCAVQLHAVLPWAAALALALATGYLVAALFPCDAGAPMQGSLRNTLHNLGGTVEYVLGAYALIQLGHQFGKAFSAAGMVVLAIALALSATSAGRGALQRVAELLLFGGLLAACLLLP